MDIEFWKGRWSEGRIGFHEGRANAHLVKHAAVLGPRRRVLVPLCGKAEDLAYLASLGHTVVGVEVVEDAVRQFFAEHELTPTVKDGRWEAAGVTILVRDVLEVTPEEVGPVDALYDRAALIALSPDVRPAYVAHVRELLAPGARGLLVGFEYDPAKMPPPPHAVFEDEIRAHYKGARLTVLDRVAADGRFTEIGAHERVYAIET